MTLGEVNKIKAKEREKMNTKFLKALDGLKMEKEQFSNKPKHRGCQDALYCETCKTEFCTECVGIMKQNEIFQ